jgi:hypothetical protein
MGKPEAMRQLLQGLAAAATLQRQAVAPGYLQAQARLMGELQDWMQRLPPVWGVTLTNITPDLLMGYVFGVWLPKQPVSYAPSSLSTLVRTLTAALGRVNNAFVAGSPTSYVVADTLAGYAKTSDAAGLRGRLAAVPCTLDAYLQLDAQLQAQQQSALQSADTSTALLLARDRWLWAMLFFTGHRPKELSGGGKMVLPLTSSGCVAAACCRKCLAYSSGQAPSTTSQQWTRRISTATRQWCSRCGWINMGRVGALYERTQQLWAAMSAARPGVQVQYYMCPVMHTRPHWHLGEGPYDTSAQEKRLGTQMAAIGQQDRHYSVSRCTASSVAACNGCTTRSRPRLRSYMPSLASRRVMSCCATWTQQLTGRCRLHA